MKLRTLATLSLGAVLLAAFAMPARAQNLNADMVKKIDEALPEKATTKPKKARKVLIYTYAAGFVHSSIPYGAYAVEAMGKKTGAYTSVISSDPAAFDDLSSYDAIVMVNTTGDWLIPKGDGAEAAKAKVDARRANIMKFIEGGHGLVGFHAASDAQYNWKEFGLMIGGYFWGHPWHEKVGIKNEDPKHPLAAAFDGKDFEITDEIYQFKEPWTRSNLHILLTLDTDKTNMKKGGINRTDGDFGVAWIRNVEKGRVFYSSLGHREEIYWNPMILHFYLDGIQFALGDLKADATPSAK